MEVIENQYTIQNNILEFKFLNGYAKLKRKEIAVVFHSYLNTLYLGTATPMFSLARAQVSAAGRIKNI